MWEISLWILLMLDMTNSTKIWTKIIINDAPQCCCNRSEILFYILLKKSFWDVIFAKNERNVVRFVSSYTYQQNSSPCIYSHFLTHNINLEIIISSSFTQLSAPKGNKIVHALSDPFYNIVWNSSLCACIKLY